MPSSLEEWSDQYWERTLARQTSQVDNAKLLATVALGISATVVATALQVEPQNAWDKASCVSLGLAFIATVATILLDRLKALDRAAVLRRQAAKQWSDGRTLRYVRELTEHLEEENDRVIRLVQRAAEYQVLLACAASGLAVVSLFQ